MNERIRELIKALNMKQAEFAKRIGVSRPFVSELCSGRKTPSDRTVGDICREFGVNEHWLYTGEGEVFLLAAAGNRTEARLNVLQGLLHYHERMMAGGIRMQDPNGTETEVPIEKLYDGYADALREAIRCVKLVNDRT